jgi:hypothetical protein
VQRSKGLWTICIHPNTTTDARFEELRAFLARHADQFTSFERVLEEFEPSPLDIFEHAREVIATAYQRVR